MDYASVFRQLTFDTAAIIFMKKDGTIRTMLATRNLNTVALKYGFKGAELGGHDHRCNINNGNLAVIDLYLGEARSFNIDRLIDIYYYGQIETAEQLDNVAEQFEEFKTLYESTMPKEINMDMLD